MLFGGCGSDRLNGGSGVDFAAGGVANDTFTVDTSSDMLRGAAAGGFEDVVRSDAETFIQGSGEDTYIERVNINKGVGDASLISNDFANTLIGNSGNDLLVGGGGDDILNGRSGSDSAFGGVGDDTLVADSADDILLELDGGGTDLVRAPVSYTLGGNQEDRFVFSTGLETGSFTYIDGAADIAFIVTGIANADELTASEFLWN